MATPAWPDAPVLPDDPDEPDPAVTPMPCGFEPNGPPTLPVPEGPEVVTARVIPTATSTATPTMAAAAARDVHHPAPAVAPVSVTAAPPEPGWRGVLRRSCPRREHARSDGPGRVGDA